MSQEELKKLVQEEKSLSAEEKLQRALDRLTEKGGKPLKTKANGRLTLNKINNEAGLGRSYIHKFKEFVDKVANPAIEAYNEKLDNPELPDQSVPVTEDMNEIEKLKEELKRQIELKEDYRKELDEALTINDKLEVLNKSLMFRVYELQQEITDEVVEYEHHKK
jgi:DNA repair ATPase RecN